MSESPDIPRQLQARYDAAVWLAREAGERTLSRFQSRLLGTELKADGSPVTVADRDAEKFLRQRIAQEFPEDGILGEEFGETVGSSHFRWVLDPIDGTKAFVCGVPLYGTLVAVELAGEPHIGVIELPALNERVHACTGRGTIWQCGDRPPRVGRVSDTTLLKRATLCFTDEAPFAACGELDFLQRMKSASGLCRGWNDCYGYALLATGRCDVVADAVMERWDLAALAPIIREAGGRFTDFRGRNALGRECIASNGKLHDQLLALHDVR